MIEHNAICRNDTTFCETLYGTLHQGGVSGLCHYGVLESGGSRGKRLLGAALVGPADVVGGQCARALDGDRDE